MPSDLPAPEKTGQGRLRRFAAGSACAFRGIVLFARTPSLAWLGFVPVLIALLMVIASTAILGVSLSSIVHALTHPLDTPGVPQGLHLVAELVLVIGLVTAWVFGVAMGFATLVQVVGGMFHEVLCDRVEKILGHAPPPTESLAAIQRARRGSMEAVLVFLLWIALSIPRPSLRANRNTEPEDPGMG